MTTYSGKKRYQSVPIDPLFTDLAQAESLSVQISPYDDHVLLTVTDEQSGEGFTLRQTTEGGEPAWLIVNDRQVIGLEARTSEAAIAETLSLMAKGFTQ